MPEPGLWRDFFYNLQLIIYFGGLGSALGIGTPSPSIYMYIYINIYVCVCVCVCVWYKKYSKVTWLELDIPLDILPRAPFVT